MCEYSRIHYCKPEGRYQTHHTCSCITSWGLGRIFIQLENLVTLSGVRMVISMALELDEKVSCETLGRVPRVFWLHTCVFSRRNLCALEAIVLSIVDGLKQNDCKYRMENHVWGRCIPKHF